MFSFKNKNSVRLFLAIFVVIVVIGFGIYLARRNQDTSISSQQEEGVLWVEDNNLHEAGGVPVDALQMYQPELLDQWSEARKQIRVYMYRYNSLKNLENGYTDTYLRDNLLPLLKESNIDFALDVPPPNWYCGNNAEKLTNAEGDYMQKISDLGGEVTYVSLQSVLSKPSDCPNYTFEKRIDNVVRFAKYIKNRFPSIQVGIIDALVAKGLDYKPVYTQLVESLAKENLKLDYIHLDFPMEKASRNWKNLREAEDFIRDELGVRVGVTYTSSRGGMTSAKKWQENVLLAFQEYRDAGGNPDDHLIMSWYNHPRQNLPEDKEFTLMNTVLKFSEL